MQLKICLYNLDYLTSVKTTWQLPQEQSLPLLCVEEIYLLPECVYRFKLMIFLFFSFVVDYTFPSHYSCSVTYATPKFGTSNVIIQMVFQLLIFSSLQMDLLLTLYRDKVFIQYCVKVMQMNFNEIPGFLWLFEEIALEMIF